MIELNVGGHHFTTTPLTVSKGPTRLAAMFDGHTPLQQDKDGRYFIDADGATFHWILNYLRNGQLPPNDQAERVYHSALYFGVHDLVTELTRHSPQILERQVKTKVYSQVENFDGTITSILEEATKLPKMEFWPKTVVWVAVHHEQSISHYSPSYPEHRCGIYVTPEQPISQITPCTDKQTPEQSPPPCCLRKNGHTNITCDCEASQRERQSNRTSRPNRTESNNTVPVVKPPPVAIVGHLDLTLADLLATRMQLEAKHASSNTRERLVWQAPTVTVGLLQSMSTYPEDHYMNLVTETLKERGFCVKTEVIGGCMVRIWDPKREVPILGGYGHCVTVFFRMEFSW